MFTKRQSLVPLALAAVLAGCVASEGTIPKSAMHPPVGSGFMLSSMPLPADALIPSMGVTPGNARTLMQTFASASPAQLAPPFSRFKAARASGELPADYELVFAVANKDAGPTIRAAASNICASAGATLASVEEKPKDKNGVRQFGMRCK